MSDAHELVLGTIAVHSATKMLAVPYLKRSIALTELAVLGTAIVVLTSGIAALG